MNPPGLRPVYSVAGRTLRVRRCPVTLPEGETIFDGSARVGARECRVRCLATPDCDFLHISGAGAFAILRQQDCIEVDPEAGADNAGDAAVEEALLGPAFALALARRGVFLLHASAVVLQDRGVVGFLGESGAGKSTLARLLVEAGEGVALAADDLLAILSGPEDAMALPHFPQLKLGTAAMSAIMALEPRYPLLGLYEIASAEAVGTEALPAVSAAALLLRHTIAGRLFASDLLAAQLDFAAGLAGRVPVGRLRVPRRMNVGGEVLRWLTRTHGPTRTGTD
jgi:hypothetical protein